MRQYKKLDTQSVIEYLFDIEEVIDFFGGSDIQAKEIGDGNLNFVYIVTSVDDPQKALIVKQAVPYLRCVGEEFPLSRERMTYEIRALKQFHKLTPSFVPKIYHSSEEMSLVVMQYLGNHIIARYGFIDMIKYPNFSEHISTYLANILFYTSSLYLQSKDKRELIEKFNSNSELCKLTEDFVFTFAFMEHKTNDNENVKDNIEAQKLFEDMEFKKQVLKLKYKFMTQTDALLHGDLHTGSIMINKDETYVIDPEFAFVGPFGFDIGALLANMISIYVSHFFRGKESGYQEWLLVTIREILEMFDEKFFDLWDETKNSALTIDDFINDSSYEEYKSWFLKNILRDSVGFAGCKMARRVYGVAGVEEIRGIEDKSLRAKAEALILRVAKSFVKNYESVDCVDDVLNLIEEECK